MTLPGEEAPHHKYEAPHHKYAAPHHKYEAPHHKYATNVKIKTFILCTNLLFFIKNF